MVFSSLDEVQLAWSLGKIDTHARIRVELVSPNRRLKTDEDTPAKPRAIIETTVGRVRFNAILPRGMPFYNHPLRSSDLAKVISDCYQMLGRH